MRIIKNEKLIQRNGKIGQWTSLAALVILGLGMYISFTKPDFFIWSLAALLTGFVLSQIGMYFGNRWGRSPRPDEHLDAALKGLPGEFGLYHFMTPASHLLVGPAGIWVLMPYHQRGRIEYQNNRWRLKGGGLLQAYMRIFGQEALGRPEAETRNEIEALKKALAKHLDENQIPALQGLLVFTSDDVEIETEDALLPAVPLKKLKDFMRQKAKERPLSAAELARVRPLLPDG